MLADVNHQDVEIFGPETRYSGVSFDPDDRRSWVRAMPCCPLMAIEHNLWYVMNMEAYAPYEIRRVRQSGSYMLACLEGSGLVLVDGGWKRVSAGQACLLPPFVTNAVMCEPDKPWRYAAVRYLESPDVRPVVTAWSPIIGAFHGAPLAAAIEGLRQETLGRKHPEALHHWCELIHHYVLSFAQPTDIDPRLWRLWRQIEKKPGYDWTLESMAHTAIMSREHLRRLCLKQLGRSPVRQLTFIRMRLAMDMLATTDAKIQTIANDVGFGSIQSFSNAFKAWFDIAPSELRRK